MTYNVDHFFICNMVLILIFKKFHIELIIESLEIKNKQTTTTNTYRAIP